MAQRRPEERTRDGLRSVLKPALSALAQALNEAGLIPTAAQRLAETHAYRLFVDGQGRTRAYGDASGSVVYPSVGSIIAHEKKAAAEGVPPYVLIGYPSATRGPGFLGPKAGYVYLTDTACGPAGLTRAPEITAGDAA